MTLREWLDGLERDLLCEANAYARKRDALKLLALARAGQEMRDYMDDHHPGCSPITQGDECWCGRDTWDRASAAAKEEA